MHSFSAPWKRQNTLWFSDVFRGRGEKWCIGNKWAKWEKVVIPYHWCNLIKLIFQRYSFETENILSKQKWSRSKFWSTKFYFDFLTSKLLSKWNWTLLHIIMCQQTISLKVVSIYFQKTFVEEDFFWNISGCRL